MFPNAPSNPFRVKIERKVDKNFFHRVAVEEFEEILVNVDSVLNLIPKDIASTKEYYCSVRYPNEPFNSNSKRRSVGIRGNPGVGRCLDCILHAQLAIPWNKTQKVLLVSIWEIGTSDDFLMGEACVPLDDTRISQTNPWPLRERPNSIVNPTPTLVTLHIVMPNFSKSSDITPYGPPPPPEAFMKSQFMVERQFVPQMKLQK